MFPTEILPSTSTVAPPKGAVFGPSSQNRKPCPCPRPRENRSLVKSFRIIAAKRECCRGAVWLDLKCKWRILASSGTGTGCTFVALRRPQATILRVVSRLCCCHCSVGRRAGLMHSYGKAKGKHMSAPVAWRCVAWRGVAWQQNGDLQTGGASVLCAASEFVGTLLVHFRGGCFLMLAHH